MTQLTTEKIIPLFVQRLLYVGALPPSVHAACQARCARTWFLESENVLSNQEIIHEGVDGIVFSPVEGELSRLQSSLEQFKTILDPNGRVTIIFPLSVRPPWTDAQWDLFLSNAGFVRYNEGAIGGDDPAWGITIVRQTYNPVLHARALADLGRPDCAIAILGEIPTWLIATEADIARLAVEKQRHYLKWQQALQGRVPALSFFSKERREFAQAASISPDLLESYQIHSRFWSAINRDDMAERTLRSIEHAFPDTKTRHMLRILQHKEHTSPVPRQAEGSNAEWQEGWPVPRILFITHGTSDYGQDTLFHGLCTLLGKENVVDYPWKPTLHKCNAESANNYPCVFDYPGTPRSVDELVARLEEGYFDIIVYSDIIGMTDQEVIRRLVNAVPHLPVVVYDPWDDCYTPMDRILEYIDRPRVELVFKREMLEGADYGAHTYPMPFGYPELFSCVGAAPLERNHKVPFWAGRNEFGLRPLYARRLERFMGHFPDARFGQDMYRQKLRSSLIGLSFFGVGFDTVRYWELPANGVMLLAERPPICIPNNFEDGVSAVFFDDLAEMEAKLEYYLQRPDEAAHIAAKGMEHYAQYHTTTARTRRFLGIMCRHLQLPSRSVNPAR